MLKNPSLIYMPKYVRRVAPVGLQTEWGAKIPQVVRVGVLEEEYGSPRVLLCDYCC